MKKIILFFLFIIISFFLIKPKTTFASNDPIENLVKIEDNPLSFDTSQIFDNNRLAPFVFYDNNRFIMLYSSIETQKIALATSNNGINWKIEKLINPISDLIEENPSLIKTNSGYKLFFSATPGLGIEIYEVELDNNFDPKIETVKKILKKNDFNWDQESVADPFVFFDENKYYLFYTAYGNGAWRLGMAILDEQNNWVKCQQPLISYNEYGAGPHVYKYENNIYLIYHSPYYEGIKYVKTNQSLSCTTQWSNSKTILYPSESYDRYHITSPSILFYNENLLLYYSGYGTNWNINLATNNPDFYKNKKISLLLPGLFASWNKKALVYNQPVNQEDWQLNPIVQEYSGIIQTFKNLGLQENQDFYLFNYDWRKSIDNISDDLNQFINKIKNNNQNTQVKFNLIGHSLGGLVARIYSQKYGTNDIEKIITVGSPHQGTAEVYKVLEAGEIETPNNIQWLIFKLILQIYKNSIKTDKQIIQEKIPVVKDLLATYPLLKDQQNNPIPIEKMAIKNDLFLNYNQTFSQIFPYLYTVSGKNFETPFGYQVKPRTVFDQLMDYYPDGRPINQLNDNGDGTVLLSSSQNGSNFINFNLNHGEIIYKKDPIKKILEQLNLNYQENQIIEGKQTNVNPSLIITLLSPATLSLTLPDNSVINDQDGLILVENAQDGNYQLKVVGNQEGQYKIIVGQITENKDYWNTIENQTSEGKEENYSIYFNSSQPEELFIDKDDPLKLKEMIINEIKLINNPPNDNLNAAIKKLSNFKKSEELFIIHKHLFNALNEINQIKWSNLLNIIDNLENFYQLTAKKPKQKLNNLKIKISQLKNKLNNLEKLLLERKNQGLDLTYQLSFYQTAREKFEKTKQAYENKNYSLTEILLETVKELTIKIQRI